MPIEENDGSCAKEVFSPSDGFSASGLLVIKEDIGVEKDYLWRLSASSTALI